MITASRVVVTLHLATHKLRRMVEGRGSARRRSHTQADFLRRLPNVNKQNQVYNNKKTACQPKKKHQGM
jgi:hypothetical protein